MNCKLENEIWSRDAGQRIPCFDRCQLTITWMSNMKDFPAKSVARLHTTESHIGIRTVAWCPKPNFLAQMDYHIFLPMVLRTHALGQRSSAIIERSLQIDETGFMEMKSTF